MKKQNPILSISSLFLKGLVCSVVILLIYNTSFAQGGTWAWMHGPETYADSGHYGKKGFADTTNNPPCRYEPAYWTDMDGNFWLFGGLADTTYNYTNDLWEYNVSAKKWIWVNGPRHAKHPAAVYGTQGVPSAANYPSARGFGSVAWTDKNGDLWMFGGYGYDTTGTTNLLTDLWRYTISTNEWTWMNGPKGGYMPTNFGTMKVASVNNRPGSRCEFKSGWVDNFNNLWFFGGEAYDSAKKLGKTNDMWKYDIATNTWTWMKGNKTDKTSGGKHGTLNVEDSTSLPNGRLSYTKWKDKKGNFYIYAGYTNTGNLNDVWRFNPHTNNWTWIAGDSLLNDTGLYKKKCVHGSGNYPASRFENQTPALQPGICSDVFWMFGGDIADSVRNDLWAFDVKKNTWTWVSGMDGVDLGKYGKRSVAATTNRIPARMGVAMWMDASYNLWVFGGLGEKELRNDLWKFIPDTTCISLMHNTGGFVTAPSDTFSCPGHYATLSIKNLDNVSVFPTTGVSMPDSSTLHFQPLVSTKYGLSYTACDNLDTLYFTIHVLKDDSSFASKSICSNKTYTLPKGEIVSASGFYIDTLNNRKGCDSIVFTSLIVLPVTDTTLNPMVCAGTRYRLPKGRTVTTSGTYSDTLKNIYACDSIVTTHLTVLSNSSFSQIVNICRGKTYTLPKGEIASDAGLYKDTLTNAVGCDSIISTTIRLLHTNLINDTSIICEGQLHTLHKGETVSTAGVYTDSFLNQQGCDSVYITTLQIMTPLSTYTRNYILCYYDSVLLDATTQGAVYAWSTGSSNSNIYASWGGYYTVSVSVAPCPPVTDTFNIVMKQCDTILQVPNAFTPNGDGNNDIFYPIHLGGITIKEFRVYNRWGELIYDKPIRGWDGTYKGVPQPQGTYIYTVIAEYASGANTKRLIKKGDVELIR